MTSVTAVSTYMEKKRMFFLFQTVIKCKNVEGLLNGFWRLQQFYEKGGKL